MLSLLSGLLFAYFARVQFAEGGSPFRSEIVAVLSFAALVLWPLAIYFYFVHPDWSWMYFLDPRRLPRGLFIGVLMLHLAALLGGYLAGFAAIKARRMRLLYGSMAGLLALLLVLSVLLRGRLSSDGTLEEYRAGTALSLSEGRLGFILVIAMAGLIAGIAITGYALWDCGRRYRS